MRARRRKQVHFRYRGHLNRAAVRRGMAREIPVGPYLVMKAAGRKPTRKERLVASYVAWAFRDKWEEMLGRSEQAFLDMLLYGETTRPTETLDSDGRPIGRT